MAKVHIKTPQKVTVRHTCGCIREYVVAGKADVKPTIAWKSGVVCPDCDPLNAVLVSSPVQQELAAKYAAWASTVR